MLKAACGSASRLGARRLQDLRHVIADPLHQALDLCSQGAAELGQGVLDARRVRSRDRVPVVAGTQQMQQQRAPLVAIRVKNLTSDNIIHRSIVTPLDHARNMPTSMVGGDVHGVAPYLYQIGGHRPTPDLAQYAVPAVERLYLVGPFLHPAAACMVPVVPRR
jgi:hypothetical protein